MSWRRRYTVVLVQHPNGSVAQGKVIQTCDVSDNNGEWRQMHGFLSAY